jgi:hypothetical protein
MTMIDSSTELMDAWLQSYSNRLGLPVGFEARFRCGSEPASAELRELACAWGMKMSALTFFSALAAVRPAWAEVLPQLQGHIGEIEKAAAARRGVGG